MNPGIVAAGWLALALLTGAPLLVSQVAPPAEGWRNDVRALTKLLKERWSYRELKAETCGVDLEVLEARALSALGEGAGREDLLRALTEYAAGLQDGHASVELGGVSLQGPRRWPVHLAEAKEGIFLLGAAREDRDAGRLLPGDVVVP